MSKGRTLVWFGLNWSLDLYDQFIGPAAHRHQNHYEQDEGQVRGLWGHR